MPQSSLDKSSPGTGLIQKVKIKDIFNKHGICFLKEIKYSKTSPGSGLIEYYNIIVDRRDSSVIYLHHGRQAIKHDKYPVDSILFLANTELYKKLAAIEAKFNAEVTV